MVGKVKNVLKVKRIKRWDTWIDVKTCVEQEICQTIKFPQLAFQKLDFANNIQLSLTLAALSLGLWWTFDRSRSGLGLGITIAFVATLITQFLVYNGVYQ